MSIHKSNRQIGDTIVEVLLSMAIVGMVLGTSFGIANRSLRIGRNAQERTEALKIAESQLELMKIESDAIETRTTNFCMLYDAVTGVKDVDDGDPGCNSIDGSGGSGLYTISIVPEKPGPKPEDIVFKINVTWERLGASGATLADRQDSLSLYYKLGLK